jgi:hypothetical protein
LIPVRRVVFSENDAADLQSWARCLASGPAGECISWLRDERELRERENYYRIGMAKVAGSVVET